MCAMMASNVVPDPRALCSAVAATDKEEIKKLRDESETLRSALAVAEKKAADSLAEVGRVVGGREKG